MLTLKMKNEYKHDIFLFQSSSASHLYVREYPITRISNPISIIGVDITVSKKKIIKPDSTHVIPYNCKGMIARGFDQVSFEGCVLYHLVDEKEEVIANGCVDLEEQRFDL